jgi:CubicO group peptidase (beta-lactamase class C family)
MHFSVRWVTLSILAWLAQSPATTTSDKLDTFLRARVAAGEVAGVVAMVVDRQSTIYSGAFGKADVGKSRPMTVDSIFRIASMTKPVTSLAAMMLVEQGELRLDDPIAKYLPAFSRVQVLTSWHEADSTYDARPPRRPITVRDLLTHTSGIAYSFVDARLVKLDDGHMSTWELPLVSDPGERFVYGPNTAVLGDIIAKVSHMPLDAFLETKVFAPLGMRDTFFSVPQNKIDRVVTTHARTADGSLRETPNPDSLKAPVRGDGGLFSTAADYGRFMQVFLNRGRVGPARLVSERTIDLMTSNQIGTVRMAEQPSANLEFARPFPIGAGKDTFGLGFQIEERPAAAGLRSAGSLSWGGIFNTHFWIDPERSIAGVVLMQLLPYYDPRALAVLRGFERETYAAALVPFLAPATTASRSAPISAYFATRVPQNRH